MVSSREARGPAPSKALNAALGRVAENTESADARLEDHGEQLDQIIALLTAIRDRLPAALDAGALKVKEQAP